MQEKNFRFSSISGYSLFSKKLEMSGLKFPVIPYDLRFVNIPSCQTAAIASAVSSATTFVSLTWSKCKFQELDSTNSRSEADFLQKTELSLT